MLLNGTPAKVLSLLKFLHHISLEMHYCTVQIYTRSLVSFSPPCFLINHLDLLKKKLLFPSRDRALHCVPDHMNEMTYMSQLENFPILIAESLSFFCATYKSKVSINYGTRNAIGRRLSPVKFQLDQASLLLL